MLEIPGYAPLPSPSCIDCHNPYVLGAPFFGVKTPPDVYTSNRYAQRAERWGWTVPQLDEISASARQDFVVQAALGTAFGPVGKTALSPLGRLIGKGITACKKGLRHWDTTRRLMKHTDDAVSAVDAMGDAAFTPNQFKALETNPNLRPPFRGNRVHVRTMRAVGDDPRLDHLRINYNRGPDFFDPATNKWWDITTQGQWQNHVDRYGSGGTRLPSEP